MDTKPTPASDPENNKKFDGSISQFFRPKTKSAFQTGKNPSRAKENRGNIVVLDDDSDDDLDGKNICIVDLTDSPEKKESRIEGAPVVNDNQDEKQGSVEQKKNIPPTNKKAIIQNEMKKEKNPVSLSSDTKKPLDTIEGPVLSPEKSSISVKKSNPFAKFAFGASDALESRVENATRSTWQQHSSLTRANKRPNGFAKNDSGQENNARSKKGHTSSKDDKKKEKEFVKMKNHPPEVQTKVTRKWHSMADPSACLQDRRYQVLLAARLHARCQEPTVRKAIQKLREHFATRSESKTITVNEMATSDPEELAVHISSLQFYNVKAKQIVTAAQEIQSRHGGIVPEDEFSLLQITGIGKTFADLLAFVNTSEAHERHSTEAVPI